MHNTIIQKINEHFYLLLLILILGFTLRIYHIGVDPPGFFCDEASIGYNAYSLLTSGKDEHGASFPLFFQSFGDYRPPLAVYSTIPFVAVFGLNETSTRLHAVFYGLIAIVLMYFLGKQIYSKSFGLLTALITATMPWLIHYNRTGFEFTIYSTFFIATVLLLVKAAHHKSYIIPGLITAGLTLYTYQPARLLIPLLLLGMLLIYRKTYFIHKKIIFTGLLTFFILNLPLILSFFNGEGTARFNMVSVFSANLPIRETLLLIIKNYFTQLSPSYFITGEPTFITRHFVGGLTPLLWITLPFLLIGLIHTFLTINRKTSQLLAYLLIIYPIAGAVTAEGPFTSRSIIGAAILGLLISLGIATTIYYGKRFANSFILSSLIIICIIINVVLFTRFYFIQYPLYSADFWGWQYGPKYIIRYFSENKENYDDLIMAPDFNEPEIFFKFYAPNDCTKCRIGLPDSSYIKDRKQLFAITPAYMTSYPNFIYRPVKIIYYPNGKAAFILAEITN